MGHRQDLMFRVVLHNNLNIFGSPASTTSRPTAVALTETSCDHNHKLQTKMIAPKRDLMLEMAQKGNSRHINQ